MKTKFVLAFLFVFVSQKSFADESAELTNFFQRTNLKAQIQRPAKGMLKNAYLIPGGPYYEQFDWDSYFMGVALSYDHVSAPLIGVTKNFIDFMGTTEPYIGYVPREIAPEGLWALPNLPEPLASWLRSAAFKAAMALKDYPWIAKHLDQLMVVLGNIIPPSMRSLPEQCKPMLAQMALLASQESKNFSWVRPYYTSIKQSIVYWESHRLTKNGLFVWRNGLESGTDNSFAVSNNPQHVTAGVDLQVYMYREYKAMAALAHALGQLEDEVLYRAKADFLRSLVVKEMWSEQDGFFYNIDTRTNQKIRALTWVGFTPLWEGMADVRQARRVITEHLLNRQEFWAPFGIRTASAAHPQYDVKNGYWRGPVWIVSNYISTHALRRYGFKAEALQLANATVHLLLQDVKRSGGMNECYNPETGAPLANKNFVSWNLLAEHMVEEVLQDKDPTQINILGAAPNP